MKQVGIQYKLIFLQIISKNIYKDYSKWLPQEPLM
jgi:hypothetical protein